MFDVLFSDENAPKTFLRHSKRKTKSSGTLELELSKTQFVLGPGLTRTRQVLSFHIPNMKTEFILEANGVMCNLYKRTEVNVPSTKSDRYRRDRRKSWRYSAHWGQIVCYPRRV